MYKALLTLFVGCAAEKFKGIQTLNVRYSAEKENYRAQARNVFNKVIKIFFSKSAAVNRAYIPIPSYKTL